jgi:hypothetical protein
MDDGEKAVQKFASETKGALDKFAEVFGVDLDDARKQVKSFGEGMQIMGRGFTASAAGSTGLTKALRILKTSLLATGVGALIIALASLGVYFTKSEQGAKELAGGMAQIKAVGDVLVDRFGKIGEGLWWLTKGNIPLALISMKEAFTGLGAAARDAGQQAKTLAESVYDLTYQERQFNVTSSEQNILLEDLRLKAKDLDLTAKQRLTFLQSAAAIEKKINREALDIAAQKILNAQADLAIDKDSKDKKDALAAAYINYNDLVSRSIQFERSLTREKNALVKEINAELEAMKEANKLSKISITNKPVGKAVDLTSLRPSTLKEIEQSSVLMQAMGQVAVDVTAEINSSFANAAVGVGEFFGALAIGQGGLASFGNLVGGVFADMAINVGKIAIGAGMAVLGIKKALMTLNPYVAIAAGTILVGLGMAVKGAMANAASGSGAASSLASGSGGGGSSFTYDTRSGSAQTQPIVIKIQGELKADGTSLKYIFDQEVTRRKNST